MKKMLSCACALFMFFSAVGFCACSNFMLNDGVDNTTERNFTESESIPESSTAVLPTEGEITEIETESESFTETDSAVSSETVSESETATQSDSESQSESETVKIHTHDFSRKDTSDKYLKSKASCLMPALYYYSCSCGEIGRDFFKNGSTVEHIYNQKNTSDQYAKIAETCTKRGVYYYSCVCGEKGENTFNGDAPKGHVFDQKNTADQFAKYQPTCTKYGVYYYSCKCGEKGDKTFKGDVLGHVFNVASTDEKYLKTPATASSEAVYYYSCSCGAKGEKTFKGALNIETCNHSFKCGRGVKYDESSGCNVSYDAYFCSLCSLEVIEHGNYYIDSVKYYVTGDCVNLKDFKIVIYGTGDMPNATPDARPMWEDYYCYETEIIIRDGITSIGDYTFYSRNPHEYVTFTIADTVSYVGRYGLYLDTENLVLGRGIKSLDVNSIGCVQNAIFLPRSIEYIRGTFDATVFYEGSREEFYNIKKYYRGEWITIGEFAEKEDSYDIAYFIYLNASGIGDRDHYLDWAE